ncbi:2TM domain-containing protein [Pseudozobellia thermophila]|uniref:Sensor histidine kinase, LytS/YehU family n=1 Tax=Pseudozobellia thermophila TaxID=192903 RepID=A0A1M6FLK4_9FLAO|nr:2TM domain-containing protein [Pseudozobellia thermophila]SHI98532.1 Sensor histidine kinase, LytS/YehU family [Pseudozobellia thermophila]
MQQFIKDIGRALLIGTIIYFVILTAFYLTGRFNTGFRFYEAWREYYENMLFSIVLYLVNIHTWRFLQGRFGSNFRSFRRLALGLGGNLVASLFGIFVARAILMVGLYGQSVPDFLGNEGIGHYYYSLLISVVVLAAFYGFYYYKYRQETKVKEQKIIAGTASAQFDALKNQLDPHFLFNSLNVLTSLIEENPRQAQKFTTSLSKVYRYVLEQKNKDLVSVAEELRFAKTYVELLKMRFEDSIVFEIPDDIGEEEEKIVPLSLQLLLENAVKHNMVTSDRPLVIRVYKENGMLVVANNLQERHVVRRSTGVGLQNIKQRYAVLTNKTLVIERSATEFRVRLPILTRQVSVMGKQQDYIDHKRYEKAKERVENIKAFYGNLLAYVIVVPFLVFLNFKTTSFPWALFPLFGWGFGVTMHGMMAFGFNPLWGKKWEEKKMREYMEDDSF